MEWFFKWFISILWMSPFHKFPNFGNWELSICRRNNRICVIPNSQNWEIATIVFLHINHQTESILSPLIHHHHLTPQIFLCISNWIFLLFPVFSITISHLRFSCTTQLMHSFWTNIFHCVIGANLNFWFCESFKSFIFACTRSFSHQRTSSSPWLHSSRPVLPHSSSPIWTSMTQCRCPIRSVLLVEINSNHSSFFTSNTGHITFTSKLRRVLIVVLPRACFCFSSR